MINYYLSQRPLMLGLPAPHPRRGNRHRGVVNHLSTKIKQSITAYYLGCRLLTSRVSDAAAAAAVAAAVMCAFLCVCECLCGCMCVCVHALLKLLAVPCTSIRQRLISSIILRWCEVNTNSSPPFPGPTVTQIASRVHQLWSNPYVHVRGRAERRRCSVKEGTKRGPAHGGMNQLGQSEGPRSASSHVWVKNAQVHSSQDVERSQSETEVG